MQIVKWIKLKIKIWRVRRAADRLSRLLDSYMKQKKELNANS